MFFDKHKGETAFILAWGGSLKGFDWNRLKGRLVIGVNDSIRLFIPTYWFFSDGRVYQNNVQAPLPPDLPVIIPDSMKHLGFPWPKQAYGIRYMGNWDPRTRTVYMQATVATAAVCFAWQLGCRKIVLLGVDCYTPEGEEDAYYADGRPAAPDHRKIATRVEPGILMEPRHHHMLAAWEELDHGFKANKCYTEQGLEIFNCSEKSRLTLFPKRSVDEFL